MYNDNSIYQIANVLNENGLMQLLENESLNFMEKSSSFSDLKQRVESLSKRALSNQTWEQNMEKRELQEGLRLLILENGVLTTGVEQLIESILPKVENFLNPIINKITEQKYHEALAQQYQLSAFRNPVSNMMPTNQWMLPQQPPAPFPGNAPMHPQQFLVNQSGQLFSAMPFAPNPFIINNPIESQIDKINSEIKSLFDDKPAKPPDEDKRKFELNAILLKTEISDVCTNTKYIADLATGLSKESCINTIKNISSASAFNVVNDCSAMTKPSNNQAKQEPENKIGKHSIEKLKSSREVEGRHSLTGNKSSSAELDHSTNIKSEEEILSKKIDLNKSLQPACRKGSFNMKIRQSQESKDTIKYKKKKIKCIESSKKCRRKLSQSADNSTESGLVDNIEEVGVEFIDKTKRCNKISKHESNVVEDKNNNIYDNATISNNEEINQSKSTELKVESDLITYTDQQIDVLNETSKSLPQGEVQGRRSQRSLKKNKKYYGSDYSNFSDSSSERARATGKSRRKISVSSSPSVSNPAIMPTSIDQDSFKSKQTPDTKKRKSECEINSTAENRKDEKPDQKQPEKKARKKSETKNDKVISPITANTKENLTSPQPKASTKSKGFSKQSLKSDTAPDQNDVSLVTSDTIENIKAMHTERKPKKHVYASKLSVARKRYLAKIGPKLKAKLSTISNKAEQQGEVKNEDRPSLNKRGGNNKAKPSNNLPSQIKIGLNELKLQDNFDKPTINDEDDTDESLSSIEPEDKNDESFNLKPTIDCKHEDILNSCKCENDDLVNLSRCFVSSETDLKSKESPLKCCHTTKTLFNDNRLEKDQTETGSESTETLIPECFENTGQVISNTDVSETDNLHLEQEQMQKISEHKNITGKCLIDNRCKQSIPESNFNRIVEGTCFVATADQYEKRVSERACTINLSLDSVDSKTSFIATKDDNDQGSKEIKEDIYDKCPAIENDLCSVNKSDVPDNTILLGYKSSHAQNVSACEGTSSVKTSGTDLHMLSQSTIEPILTDEVADMASDYISTQNKHLLNCIDCQSDKFIDANINNDMNKIYKSDTKCDFSDPGRIIQGDDIHDQQDFSTQLIDFNIISDQTISKDGSLQSSKSAIRSIVHSDIAVSVSNDIRKTSSSVDCTESHISTSFTKIRADLCINSNITKVDSGVASSANNVIKTISSHAKDTTICVYQQNKQLQSIKEANPLQPTPQLEYKASGDISIMNEGFVDNAKIFVESDVSNDIRLQNEEHILPEGLGLANDDIAEIMVPINAPEANNLCLQKVNIEEENEASLIADNFDGDGVHNESEDSDASIVIEAIVDYILISSINSSPNEHSNNNQHESNAAVASNASGSIEEFPDSELTKNSAPFEPKRSKRRGRCSSKQDSLTSNSTQQIPATGRPTRALNCSKQNSNSLICNLRSSRKSSRKSSCDADDNMQHIYWKPTITVTKEPNDKINNDDTSGKSNKRKAKRRDSDNAHRKKKRK
ncbi:hypothetical protein GJ496_002371 [Pomphorhynchus laevis]|nr:hypothetical protein GJ496_002371 [Pomphorhynchus laevis]